jgi:hypothetical protein
MIARVDLAVKVAPTIIKAGRAGMAGPTMDRADLVATRMDRADQTIRDASARILSQRVCR